MTSVVCILSGVLGNRVVSRRLADSVDRALGASTECIWFDDDTYRKHPAPPLLRRISAIESEVVAKRMLSGRRFAGIAVVNGYALAHAAMPRCDRLVVATDATPRLVGKIPVNRRGFVRRAMLKVHDMRFQRLANHVDQWLPISSTCKQSLIDDYGVPPERCHVTRSPQPVIHASAIRSGFGRPRELLFVGNDLARKGGFVLIEAFRRRLLPDCRLTVVSRDPALKNVVIQDVTIRQDITDPSGVSDAYLAADLLVLPTSADHFPNVICEALAHGLPFLATGIGAIPELLRTGAGLELTLDPDPATLARLIHGALEDEADQARRSEAAIRFAKSYLTQASFDSAVRDALRAMGVRLKGDADS